MDFKGSHFEKEIILWGIRWYVAYPMSYRQLEEMMRGRCFRAVDLLSFMGIGAEQNHT